MRMAADNKLDFDAYPTDIEYAFNNFAIPWEKFLEIMMPAFPVGTPRGDVEAITGELCLS